MKHSSYTTGHTYTRHNTRDLVPSFTAQNYLPTDRQPGLEVGEL